ncbi:unnamed protein product [Brassica oleracea]
MRSQGLEDNKGCLGPGTPEMNGHGNIGFEFQKGANRTPNHHRSTTGETRTFKMGRRSEMALRSWFFSRRRRWREEPPLEEL